MSEEKDIWQADDGRPMCRHGGRSHSLNLACPTDDCERCGRPNDEHPTVCPNQSGEMFMVPADIPRAPKWQRVEPGHMIPEGQPYRVEFTTLGDRLPAADERVMGDADEAFDEPGADWFIDSSWKPPLVLPTEPTWGIAVIFNRDTDGPYYRVEKLRVEGRYMYDDHGRSWQVERIRDFIPLTDEQVQRIEAAR